MSLVVSTIFLVFGVVAIGLGVVFAVYMVLGLLLVKDLRQCDSEHEALQLQARFLADGVPIPSDSDLVLKNTTSLDSPGCLQGKALELSVERFGQ